MHIVYLVQITEQPFASFRTKLQVIILESVDSHIQVLQKMQQQTQKSSYIS
jgi:hypothetical protein